MPLPISDPWPYDISHFFWDTAIYFFKTFHWKLRPNRCGQIAADGDMVTNVTAISDGSIADLLRLTV